MISGAFRTFRDRIKCLDYDRASQMRLWCHCRPLATLSSAPFLSRVKTTHKDYAARKSASDAGDEFEYLRKTVGSMLIDRLKDISRTFEVGVDMGSHTGILLDNLLEHADFEVSDPNFTAAGGIKKVIQIDSSALALKVARQRWEKLIPEEHRDKLALEQKQANLEQTGDILKEQVDIILSNMALHWSNDLTKTIKEVNARLKPDGAFLCSMLGGETLFELRTALTIAEQEREGGVSAHISPMLQQADACSLLSNAGLTLSTVDTTTIQVHFKDMFSLIEHLGAMGESNASRNMRDKVSRDTFLAAAAAYQHMFGNKDDNYIPATFQIIFMIGWKPDPSQPKPLKPGDAKIRFTKALKNKA